MLGIYEIVTAVIVLFLLVSVGVFIFAIISDWGKVYLYFWGVVIVLCSHLLLFYLVVIAETTALPPLLKKYTLWILDLLAKLVSF